MNALCKILEQYKNFKYVLYSSIDHFRDGII